MCANTFYLWGWHTQEEKDELTSCRGTVQSGRQKPPVRFKGGRAGLSKKGKWPPRGTGTTVLTYPGSAPRVTGKAGENGHHSGEVGGSSPGQDRRLPSVVTHSRLQRATSVRSRVRIVLEDVSGVAIDWVTGRSYSSARRRLNVQSGQREGRTGAALPYPSVAFRDRSH